MLLDLYDAQGMVHVSDAMPCDGFGRPLITHSQTNYTLPIITHSQTNYTLPIQQKGLPEREE